MSFTTAGTGSFCFAYHHQGTTGLAELASTTLQKPASGWMPRVGSFPSQWVGLVLAMTLILARYL